MSAGWFLCHSLCLAVHCCFGIIWLGDSQCSRACRELLHKLCMAAARSALPVPHGVTSHLRCGDTHCHHACAPVLSAQREEGPRRLLTRLGDEQICPCFAVLAQSQQGGKPPNHVGQPIGAQAGTKPKSRVRGSQFCWGRQEAFMWGTILPFMFIKLCTGFPKMCSSLSPWISCLLFQLCCQQYFLRLTWLWHWGRVNYQTDMSTTASLTGTCCKATEFVFRDRGKLPHCRSGPPVLDTREHCFHVSNLTAYQAPLSKPCCLRPGCNLGTERQSGTTWFSSNPYCCPAPSS